MESKRVIDTIMNENEHRALDFDESESMSNDFGICKIFFFTSATTSSSSTSEFSSVRDRTSTAMDFFKMYSLE